ncbi:MAG: response regulator [Marinilabiliales bacterium]|nr:MAG: response regulator [Marinilabiliales bacterium]
MTEKSKLKNYSILAVDDSEINLRLLKEVLKESQIITLNSGNDCLIYLKEYTPDIIVLDIMMPDMNGFEVLSHIRANKETEKIPVIMLTAMSRKEAAAELVNFQVQGFIQKPFKPRKLIKQIISILDKKEAKN